MVASGYVDMSVLPFMVRLKDKVNVMYVSLSPSGEIVKGKL